MARAPAVLLALALSLAGCASEPLDPLWHEELDARLVLWDVANDELRVRIDVDPPARELGTTVVEPRLRVQELRVADAAVDLYSSTLTQERKPTGTIALELRAPLVTSGAATEPRLSMRGQIGLYFRGEPRTATIQGWQGAKEGSRWKHPEVPGLQLELAYWSEEALSVRVERPPGGYYELCALDAKGQRVPSESFAVSGVVRLSFPQGCPQGSSLRVAWRDEWRCRAQIDEEDFPGRP